MSRLALTILVVVSTTSATACASKPATELDCQKRIVRTGKEAETRPDDPFEQKAYSELDRRGCSAKQLGQLDQLIAMTREFPALLEANNKASDLKNAGVPQDATMRWEAAVKRFAELQDQIEADLLKQEQAK